MTNKQKTDWDFNGDFEDIQLGITKSEDIKNRRFITSWLNRKRLELLTRFDTQKKQLLKTQRQQLISEIEGIKRLPNMAQNQNGNEYCSACGCPWDNIDNYCPDCATHNQALVDIIKILENK